MEAAPRVINIRGVADSQLDQFNPLPVGIVARWAKRRISAAGGAEEPTHLEKPSCHAASPHIWLAS